MKKLVFFVALTLSAESKVKLESLPAAVQAAVKQQTQNATLVGISKETEGGKTMYEVETKVNGKSRDMIIDPSGTVVEVEEEVALDSIPAPAREALQKKAGTNKIKKVELLTKGSATSYEAAIANKLGKTSEYGVNPDGTPHK
jgi:uncharacterized membrane protein YkoI